MRIKVLIATLILFVIGSFFFLLITFDGTPICFFDSSYPIDHWKTNSQDRYCIMKRIVSNQELKGLNEKEIEELLGKHTGEFFINDEEKYIRYATQHGFLIGTYYLGITYVNGKADNMCRELD